MRYGHFDNEHREYVIERVVLPTSEDEFKSPTVIPTSEKDRIHGPEDACSDDALWLIASIVEYATGSGAADYHGYCRFCTWYFPGICRG